MRKERTIRDRFYKFLKLLEMFIALCIVVVILVMMGLMLFDYLTGRVDLRQTASLETFLQEMLTFVVGIEFVKMLIFHNPDRVIDVLIFATSRQMVVEHTDGVETIIRIVGIGCLFAIQRFLIPHGTDAPYHGHEEHP